MVSSGACPATRCVQQWGARCRMNIACCEQLPSRCTACCTWHHGQCHGTMRCVYCCSCTWWSATGKHQLAQTHRLDCVQNLGHAIHKLTNTCTHVPWASSKASTPWWPLTCMVQPQEPGLPSCCWWTRSSWQLLHECSGAEQWCDCHACSVQKSGWLTPKLQLRWDAATVQVQPAAARTLAAVCNILSPTNCCSAHGAHAVPLNGCLCIAIGDAMHKHAHQESSPLNSIGQRGLLPRGPSSASCLSPSQPSLALIHGHALLRKGLEPLQPVLGGQQLRIQRLLRAQPAGQVHLSAQVDGGLGST